MASSNGLHVIALVSGGKDSFFSALHCLENGHRLVALANLHPAVSSSEGAAGAGAAPTPSGEAWASSAGVTTTSGANRLGAAVAVGSEARDESGDADGARPAEDDVDLNSFMYQTVGHQVIPLYADATGIPLYRRPIVGGARHTERDYAAAASDDVGDEEDDETESMMPLLRAVMKDHPEANALSAGAILSTYQRTRVESVALRLGLTPLAYLWKYPILPPPGLGARDEAQLLLDMAAAGMDPRIIKVASGGLDESYLWENVASAKGVMRLKRAMGRFGSTGLDTGAVLGEGGEFETLVIDGPSRLFKKRVVVEKEDQVVVREGGGQAWLKVTRARVEDKAPVDEQDLNIRRPNMLDERFMAVLSGLRSDAEDTDKALVPNSSRAQSLTFEPSTKVQTWAITSPETSNTLTIEEETTNLINTIRSLLAKHALPPTSIISTTILLRSMADFPAINTIYSTLFTAPNPPSRVTISCGDLLPPQSGNIAIYITLHTTTSIDRQGLHVQSRSYWAPANIGPYSQAVSYPVTPSGARAVHIAGQIPLVPASMAFLAPPDDGLDAQLVLALQHLWRVGAEVRVQWWTSAAVYFPRSASSTSPQQQARLAWRAWRDAHRWASDAEGEDGDDEGGGGGPDLWDRKFNTRYMSFGGGDDAAAEAARLPDYAVVEGEDGVGNEDRAVPFFWAVEVDELPRSAAVEWHAHAGLSGLTAGVDSVRLCRDEGKAAVVEHCVLVSKGGGGCLHSVVALRTSEMGGRALEECVREADELFGARVAKLAAGEKLESEPYLVYVDTNVFASAEISQAMSGGLAIIPCASIYGGAQGERLKLVALYRRGLSSREES